MSRLKSSCCAFFWGSVTNKDMFSKSVECNYLAGTAFRHFKHLFRILFWHIFPAFKPLMLGFTKEAFNNVWHEPTSPGEITPGSSQRDNVSLWAQTAKKKIANDNSRVCLYELKEKLSLSLFEETRAGLIWFCVTESDEGTQRAAHSKQSSIPHNVIGEMRSSSVDWKTAWVSDRRSTLRLG